VYRGSTIPEKRLENQEKNEENQIFIFAEAHLPKFNNLICLRICAAPHDFLEAG
jgi:hypothetical protein